MRGYRVAINYTKPCTRNPKPYNLKPAYIGEKKWMRGYRVVAEKKKIAIM